MRKPPSFLKRTVAAALVALVFGALFFIAPPLADGRDAALFGLPLRVALTVPAALPVLVLIMFWFAAHQNREDERFHDDG